MMTGGSPMTQETTEVAGYQTPARSLLSDGFPQLLESLGVWQDMTSVWLNTTQTYSDYMGLLKKQLGTPNSNMMGYMIMILVLKGSFGVPAIDVRNVSIFFVNGHLQKSTTLRPWASAWSVLWPPIPIQYRLHGFLGREHFMKNATINGGTQNDWFTMENPIKVDDDWGYPNVRKPIYRNSVPRSYLITWQLILMDFTIS